MKVRALKLFNDLQSGTLRKPGEEFEATKRSVSQLNAHPLGNLVEVIEKEKPEKVV